MFHDEVELFLQSGKGGDGCVSFRREKYIPKGGPDGGDGGKGGSVFVVASRQQSDLNDLSSTRELKAENGTGGGGRKLTGKDGEDLIVSVPLGTRIWRQYGDDWKLLHDFTEENKPKLLLRGGRGGLGNVHFATATHQTPRHAQPGEPGARARYRFELQLIADVGIIGLPNAGKSTFLSIITEAKPKVADYPFTTLSPVLGVASYFDMRMVFADIPGLIEGAAEGKGLGHTFLRHIRRTRALVHFIESLSDDYARDYLVIRQELAAFDASLTSKPELVVITKSELIQDPAAMEENVDRLRHVLEPSSVLFDKVSISAVAKQNIDTLLESVSVLLRSSPGLDRA